MPQPWQAESHGGIYPLDFLIGGSAPSKKNSAPPQLHKKLEAMTVITSSVSWEARPERVFDMYFTGQSFSCQKCFRFAPPPPLPPVALFCPVPVPVIIIYDYTTA